jgi:hypothetical protein
MSHPSRPEGVGPTSQQLAAYVDGELGPTDRAVVETWLRDHPEDQADVDAHRRLLRLWQAGSTPAPGEAAWAGALARIEAGLAAGAAAARPVARGPHLAGVVRLAAAVAAVAAVLVLGLSLTGVFSPRPPTPVEPLPVASEGDVEILSIEGDDVRALVVGQPPVHGRLMLASSDDVTVEKSGRDVQVPRPAPEHAPDHHHQRTVEVPMVIPTRDPSLQKAAP